MLRVTVMEIMTCDNDDKVNAEEADACTLEILEAIDVDKDGDVTMVRGRDINIYY